MKVSTDAPNKILKVGAARGITFWAEGKTDGVILKFPGVAEKYGRCSIIIRLVGLGTIYYARQR